MQIEESKGGILVAKPGSAPALDASQQDALERLTRAFPAGFVFAGRIGEVLPAIVSARQGHPNTQLDLALYLLLQLLQERMAASQAGSVVPAS